MAEFFKKQPSARILAAGFALVILVGSALLLLPCCVRSGVSVRWIDTLYTSTSAVCVTGLVVLDPADTFTPLGQGLIGVLIQIGGLGVAAVGALIILAIGRRIDLKGRSLIREAGNLDSGRGAIRFVRSVFFTTVTFELIGAALSYFVFARDLPPLRALGVSLFHAVAAFNNAGFDILGGFRSLSPYRDDVWLNLVTCALVILGGLGFLVLREVREKRFRWERFSMHTKVVLAMSLFLTVLGTVLFKLSEELSWLGAFFHSVSARTAGYSTVPLGSFSAAGLLVMAVLMLIGASPGSTGGGIKTTTVFALLQGIKSAATNRSEKAFRYAVPAEAFRKSAVILLMALAAIGTGTYLLLLLEPQLALSDAFFEITSAFATVGLSTGITPTLSDGSKVLTVLIMYIGRLGPMTIATLWYFGKGERVKFPDGNLSVG